MPSRIFSALRAAADDSRWKMSRRKQANPRSIKALGELPASEDPDPISRTDCDIASPPVDHLSKEEDQDDCPELIPLVVDTTTPPPSLDSSPPPLSIHEPSAYSSSEAPSPATPIFGGGLRSDPVTLNLLPSVPSPRSPGFSTPSSPSGPGDSANKKNRGKKIMPVAGEDGKARWQCPICQEELGSDHDLTVHIRSHNTTQAKQPNTCTICGKVLSSQSSLDRHMLVHSGERPFKCKVCHMAFTTNGNMHRHSRIHAKDELKAAQGGSSGGKSSKSSSLQSSSTGKSPSTRNRSNNNTRSEMGATPSWHRPQSYSPNSLDHGGSLMEPLSASGIDLQQYMLAKELLHRPPVFPSTFSTQSSMGFTPEVDPTDVDNIPLALLGNRKRLSQGNLDHLSIPSPSKQPCVNEREGSLEGGRPHESHSATPSTSEEAAVDLTMSDSKKSGPDEDSHNYNSFRKQQQHHHHQMHPEEAQCHLCHKTFISEYGFMHHMEQHRNDSNKSSISTQSASQAAAAAITSEEHPCTKCKEVFPSARRLIVHMLLVHNSARLQSELASTPSMALLAAGKNGMHKALEASTPGFADLDFLDFTTNKFSLAAKAWCEKNPRRPSSQFHNFSCKKCSCSFPTESSLELHAASHKPHNWTRCPLCDCYFVSSDLLHTHMHKHIADKAMTDSLRSDKGEDAGKPEAMEKDDFLAMFDLVPTNEVTDSQKNETILENINKAQNNEYFAKVGRFLRARQISNEKMASSVDGSGEKSPEQFPHSADSNPSDVPSMSAAKADFASSIAQGFPSSTPGVPSSTSSMVPRGNGIFPTGFLNMAPGFPSVSGVSADFSPSSPSPLGAISMLHASDQRMFSPPLVSSPSPLGAEAGDSLHDKQKGVCKYCGETFNNLRSLKGHTRVHLGLSPYKCNLCSYSSADKSTLIRHLRTHNGERPFQCLICEYAFTTKANCERHVRKKHEKVEKEEIEKAITYNKYTTDLTTALKNFHSPDTVCKFCGQDFKFFRALKHHLRSHSSCRQKPFMCTKCQVGFSMKANCIRHIQKQHAEVSQLDIEQFIHVNELAQNSTDNDDTDDIQGDDASCSPSSTPGLPLSSSTPPTAHSTPGLPSEAIAGVREFLEPLDFSLKNPVMAARLTGMFYPLMGGAAKEEGHEQPMDLTVKRRSVSPSPSSSAVNSPAPSPVNPSNPFRENKAAASKFSTPVTPDLPCPLCKKTFGHKDDLISHLHDVHQVPLSLDNSLSADKPLSFSDSNNNTSTAVISPFLQMSVPLQLMQARMALAANTTAFPPHPAFPHMQQKLAYLGPRTIAPGLLQGVAANIKKEPGTGTAQSSNSGSASDSSCDLASVNKILDTTDAKKFQAFLKPASATNSASEDNSEPQSAAWESADDDSDQSLDQLYAQSLQNKMLKAEQAAAKEVANAEKDGIDQQAKDSGASDEQGEDSRSRNLSDLDKSLDGDDDDVVVMQVEGLKTELVDSGSEKASPNGPDGKSSDGSSAVTPVKKKRNSYADSPHKLNCPYCPRSFPWVSSLNRHLLTHTGQKPFKCPRCPVTFSTKSNRERHLIRKHGVNMLDPASRQTMDRPYKCHLCVFSSFSTESNLLKHYKERHPGCSPPERYKDKMDGDGMFDPSTADLSMDRMDETSMDGTLLLNRTENSSLDSSEQVSPLMKSPVPVSTSPKSMEAVVAALLKKDIKEPTTTTAASFTPTTNNNGMDDNDEDDSDNQSQNDGSFPNMSSSLFSGSGERHINPERDNYNVDKITNCWKCGEEFNSRKLLVRHLKEHNIDLPYKCYLCDASYDTRQECLVHQEKSHASDWAILKEKNGVDNVDTYAERLDRIVERNCKTGHFVDEGDDQEPGGMPTGIDDGQGGDAVASDYLQRKVYCSLCPKRFWSLQDLRRHMRSHTGERPFECDKCGKRFTLKHSMMRHRRKHTAGGIRDSPCVLSDDEESIQEDTSPVKVPATHTGTGHRALRQHLALTAALNKPIACAPTTGRVADTILTPASLPSTILDDDKNDDNEDDGDDILHNLLGVESATIDQIFDAKDSAASLLGVKDKV